MDEPSDYHTKWNKSEKDNYITHMWNLKNNTNKLIYKTETDSDIENKHGYQRGIEEWRDNSGIWD